MAIDDESELFWKYKSAGQEYADTNKLVYSCIDCDAIHEVVKVVTNELVTMQEYVALLEGTLDVVTWAAEHGVVIEEIEPIGCPLHPGDGRVFVIHI